jgi:cytochrome c556
MKKKLLSAGLALTLCAGAGYLLNAFAQAKPDTLVKQRQAAMILQAKYFYGGLRPMAQGKRPYDATVVVRNAVFLDALSRMPWDNYTPDTKDEKSRSLPAIWEQPAKFKEAQDRFQSEVSKLVVLTKSGDEAAIKTQILAVDKICSSCHDDFRGK